MKRLFKSKQKITNTARMPKCGGKSRREAEKRRSAPKGTEGERCKVREWMKKKYSTAWHSEWNHKNTCYDMNMNLYLTAFHTHENIYEVFLQSSAEILLKCNCCTLPFYTSTL